MSEWKEYKLGEIAEIVGGGTPTTSNPEYWGGDIPWLSPKDLTGYKKIYISHGERNITESGLMNSSAKMMPKGTVLFSSRAPIGYVAIAKNPVCTNQGFKSFVCRQDKVLNLFLYYWLKNNVEYFQSLGTGTTFAEISGSAMRDIEISLPPINVQKRIAGVLSSLDDKIDLLHRENATLEALAETLFRHYFIENPDPTWKEGKLGDYVIETIGGEWGTEVPEGESNMPVRCLRGADVADLNDGIATRTPLRYIKPIKYEKIKPNNGDVILEISGGTDTCSTGRVAYINEGVKQLFDYPIVFSNFCRLLRVKEEYTYFVYCYFRHLHKQGEFFNLENGSSGIHNLNYKAALYDDLGWPVPTDEKLVIKFGEKVKPYFDKINTNKKQVCTLIQTRNLSLHKLMSKIDKI